MKEHREILVCTVLVLMVFAVFGQTLGHPFINYDDGPYVLANPHVRSGFTWKGMLWAFTTFHTSYWHPLTWLSHTLDCRLFGLKPWGHHLMSVLLHAANSAGLYWALRRMTRRLKGSQWKCLFVAAVFAVHPLHVESVAWVAERKDVLSAFFWIAAMGLYARYCERPGVGRYLLVALAFALSLMSKPMVVTLPVVLLLLDYWPLDRVRLGRASGSKETEADGDGSMGEPPVAQKPFSMLILEKIPLFLLGIAASAAAIVAQRGVGALDTLEARPLWFRIENAANSYGAYAAKTFWPSGLAPFYPLSTDALSVWKITAAAVFLVAVTEPAVREARRRRYLIVGWLWYLVTLAPVIGLVQVGRQAMADRYTYLPMIGVLMMIAWGIPELAARFVRRESVRETVLGAVATAAVAALMAVAVVQTHYWRDTRTLFGHVLRVTENNYMAHYLCGVEDLRRDNVDQALEHLAKAAVLYPDFADARFFLGEALAKQGQWPLAAEQYETALRLDPNRSDAHCGLGFVAAMEGKNDEALRELGEAARLDGAFVKPHFLTGEILMAQGKTREAAAQWREGLRIAEQQGDAAAQSILRERLQSIGQPAPEKKVM